MLRQLFYLGVAGYIGVTGLSDYTAANASKHWATTSGRIVSAREEVVHRKTWTSKEAYIQYRYKVKGHAYLGDRIKFGGTSWEDAKAVLKQYPGPTVQVHYDPSNPSNSSLSPTLNQAATGIKFLLVLGAIAVMFLDEKGK